MKKLPLIAPACSAVLLLLVVVGCADDNDRKPTAAEGAAADVKRQASIDSLNIPQASKDAMKAHLGGGAAAPTDASARGGK